MAENIFDDSGATIRKIGPKTLYEELSSRIAKLADKASIDPELLSHEHLKDPIRIAEGSIQNCADAVKVYFEQIQDIMHQVGAAGSSKLSATERRDLWSRLGHLTQALGKALTAVTPIQQQLARAALGKLAATEGYQAAEGTARTQPEGQHRVLRRRF
jgi:hypothetical protein